ncbi:hypothetical protein E4Z66_09495 [Aliishimia ponticola]|uniref:DUF1772 domain-containing protein n=1 Tax=Aliishimia ponticola TaxID=2499833 RepID=A0A4S4NCJ7_9RHOB|nr:hypothetical protein [Aliishimia ponticola]THH37152.1 hypothetical protein E4Z66_09495 [Aliishimia ponticola]
MGRFFILSLVVAILCLAAFRFLVPGLTAVETLPFDLRFGGYDLTSTQDYLRDLDARGQTGAYLTFYRWIDTVFPVAVFGVVASAIWGLWWRPAPAIAVLGILVSAGYVVADYVENASVAALLRTGADGVTADAVLIASSATQGKWVALLAAAMLAVLGLLVTLVRGRD